MEKTSGCARRRQLLAAVSILGISLGMGVEAAQASSDNGAGGTQVSQKDQASIKLHQGSIKTGTQSSLKTQDAYKQNSIKGQTSIKGESTQQKGNAWARRRRDAAGAGLN